MLDVSKLQSGQLSLNVSEFEIKDALTQVINALKPQQEERQIEVVIQGDACNIEADFVQLSRVLENYHSNALKYTKSKIEWFLKKENDKFLIIVQDDGEGIPAEYLKRIFDPFVQVPGKEKKGSTGLGLDSVKDLVKLHQGETWAESEGASKGSRFCLRIPITQR
ncbi:MAG: HAMP domain-containing histidine kinase [SAR324 cluster bacterium]|nr:HAMP domain-containing histidine kinase [SAR324 cluster bacterium]